MQVFGRMGVHGALGGQIVEEPTSGRGYGDGMGYSENHPVKDVGCKLSPTCLKCKIAFSKCYKCKRPDSECKKCTVIKRCLLFRYPGQRGG